MNFSYTKPEILLLLILFVINFPATPACSEGVKPHAFEGKITKAENYLINWDWWENFNAPCLVDIVRQSSDNSFDLQIAGIKAKEAENYVASSIRDYFPFIGMEKGYRDAKPARINSFGWKKDSPVYNTGRNLFFSPLKTSYELDLWGKNKTKKKYFLEKKDFYEFEKRLILLKTVSEAASLYFNIIKNEKLIGLYQEINGLKQEKLDINRKKHDLELIPKSEVINSEKELKLSEVNLINLKALNGELKNRLCFLVFGDKENTGIDFEGIDSLNLFYDTDLEVSTDKIAYRPDVLMAEKQVKIAKLDADAVKKALLPGLMLSGEAFHITETFKNYFDYGSVAYRTGGGIFYNLFAKGSNRAELRAKKNVYKQALKNYEKTIVSSIYDVNDSLFYLKSSIKNYKKAQEISKLEKENLYAEKQKLDMDLITYSEYIKAREQFIKSRIAEYEARAQCLVHTISLYKALGGNV